MSRGDSDHDYDPLGELAFWVFVVLALLITLIFKIF